MRTLWVLHQDHLEQKDHPTLLDVNNIIEIVNSFLSFATILSYNFINANENFWSDSLCSLSFSYIVQHIEGFYCRKNIFYDFFSAVTLFNALSQPSLNLINLSLEHLNYPIYMYPDYLS